MGTPAYTRLENDERRRRLLELGARLFTEHAYDEISMARIAREAGISKALLYHYSPSKQDVLHGHAGGRGRGGSRARRARRRRCRRPGAGRALDAYLAWVEDNAAAYAKLFRSAAGVPEVRELVDGVRADTAERILDGLARRPTPGRARRCAAGCGSWTARAWTGSPTATSRAPSCTACCSGRWPEP